MRLGDYKYPTDYRAHKQWGHETLWIISNATLISSVSLAAVIRNRPSGLFGSETDSHWIHTGFLFHASVAYSLLCSVAYTREHSDSSQPVYADIIMTSVAFCLAPTALRGAVVSIMTPWFPLAPTSTEGLAWRLTSTLAELWHTPLKVLCEG